MTCKTGLPIAVIFESNLGRTLLEGKRLGMTGFTSFFHLMVFMAEGNGFCTLTEVDGFLRGGKGLLMTPTAIAPCKCIFARLVMAGKAGFTLAVIFEINLCRTLLEGEGLRMAGFTSSFQLMALMAEGNGFFPRAEVDSSLRGGNGLLVTPTAITPRKRFFPLLVMAGKAGFALGVIRHFDAACPFFGFKQGWMATSAC